MEDARFFHQKANRCYQLAWQSFDLQVAHTLNRLGNEHKAKARELSLAQTRSLFMSALSPLLEDKRT
jgi:hypothetical protein